MNQESKAAQLTCVCLSICLQLHTVRARVKEVQMWNYQRLVMLGSMSVNAVHAGSSPFRRQCLMHHTSYTYVRTCA